MLRYKEQFKNMAQINLIFAVVYEYFYYDSKTISSKALTDLETSYIEKFGTWVLILYIAPPDPGTMKTATSLTGYKHTEEAKLKMKDWYKDKNNHPMFGKTHREETLPLISKPPSILLGSA